MRARARSDHLQRVLTGVSTAKSRTRYFQMSRDSRPPSCPCRGTRTKARSWIKSRSRGTAQFFRRARNFRGGEKSRVMTRSSIGFPARPTTVRKCAKCLACCTVAKATDVRAAAGACPSVAWVCVRACVTWCAMIKDRSPSSGRRFSCRPDASMLRDDVAWR